MDKQVALTDLFDNNRDWAEKIKSQDPEFFSKLSGQQNPEFLWIGCSDSRVPANELLGLLPGELFVHRNVANVVSHTDFNCHAVIQYAVEVLKVRHIIICGHYGCGGVKAAIEGRCDGLIDSWLSHIRDVYSKHRGRFHPQLDREQQVNMLCELNVREQLLNVCQSSSVQQAWRTGQSLHVHGWIYSIMDGILNDLGLSVSCFETLAEVS